MGKKWLLGMAMVMSVLICEFGYCQDRPYLDHLFSDWAISDQESKDEILVMRDPSSRNHLTIEDMKTVYSFQMGKDSVINVSNLINRGFGCITEPINHNNFDTKREVWSLNYDERVLMRGYYFGADEEPVYQIKYSIAVLEDGYLRLQLLDEFFR